ncbi:3-isopropylmalate dehydratase [Klebsormidium nitens]|uniref:3-isopropylmalate dehydratase n=1 Tax=Klebsormidium nitens TaxID=105231 RepID=A0A1Y1I3V1_KLENI|nr:3-isopropylmalate dehydratase [Klebsormidium nitens]|eukprot:GAQ84642.1 3-isopropylmalate dehydratase [Klebsormidium nitens]
MTFTSYSSLKRNHNVPVKGHAKSFLGSSAPLISNLAEKNHQASVARFSVRAEAGKQNKRVIRGPVFVVDDNIDTDQIIPAEYLTLVPSKPEEYEKLGSYAMAGLPKGYGIFIEEGEMKTKYPIMIGGKNYGCGSSREHAPVALGAAGLKAVVAESYARIFFRNSVATGELYPVEIDTRLCEELKTGDEVTVDMENDVLTHHGTGKQYNLKPIGEAGPVIDAGGLFNYARQTGMIKAAT